MVEGGDGEVSFEVETQGAEEGGYFDGRWEDEFLEGAGVGPVVLW